MRWSNVIAGWIVYPLGDLLAQLITGEFDLRRLVVIALAGGLIYRYEVPWWFRKLDNFRFEASTLQRSRMASGLARADGHLNWLGRTLGAILYFNPLWIARHMILIRLGANPAAIQAPWPLLRDSLLLGAKSFAVNLPISFAGNYLIQMRTPLQWRFLASSIFSGLLAAAYALAYRYF